MAQDNVILRCPGCGTRNRIPRNRLGDAPVCGKCRTALPLSGAYDRPVEIGDRTFHDEVLLFPGLVLVDFWAPWCGPCQTIGPIVQQLARDYAGKLKVAKLNLDQNPLSAARYNVQSVPSLLLFKNGKLADRLVGALPKPQIEERLRALL